MAKRCIKAQTSGPRSCRRVPSMRTDTGCRKPASRSFAGHEVWVIALGLALASAGCVENGKAPKSELGPDIEVAQVENQTALDGMPGIPAPEAEQAAQESGVRETYQSGEEARYRRQEGMTVGALRGICCIPFPRNIRGPKPAYEEVNLEDGKQIVGPLKDEVKFYSRFVKPRKAVHRDPACAYLGRYANGRYPVKGALLTLPDIRVGVRPRLGRPTFTVWTGGISGGFGMVPDRVRFRSHDPFPWELVLTSSKSDKPLCEVKLPKREDTRKCKLAPSGVITAWNSRDVPWGSSNLTAWRGKAPTKTSSIVLTEPGQYRVRCKRHGFSGGTLFMLKNPYFQYNKTTFSFTGIPAGRHRLRIWHPHLQPVTEFMEVEIKAKETLEIMVKFKPLEHFKQVLSAK